MMLMAVAVLVALLFPSVSSFKIAITGDTGVSTIDAKRGRGSTQGLFRMFQRQGVSLLLHNGDFEYSKSGEWWEQRYSAWGDNIDILGTSGNHEAMSWVHWVWYKKNGHKDLMLQRMYTKHRYATPQNCKGDYGERHFCLIGKVAILGFGWRETEPGTDEERLSAQWGEEQLRAANADYVICQWHRTGARVLNDMCTKYGAMIIHGHHHFYRRDDLMTDKNHRHISPKDHPTVMQSQCGHSFSVIVGMGGWQWSGHHLAHWIRKTFNDVDKKGPGVQAGALVCDPGPTEMKCNFHVDDLGSDWVHDSFVIPANTPKASRCAGGAIPPVQTPPPTQPAGVPQHPSPPPVPFNPAGGNNPIAPPSPTPAPVPAPSKQTPTPVAAPVVTPGTPGTHKFIVSEDIEESEAGFLYDGSSDLEFGFDAFTPPAASTPQGFQSVGIAFALDGIAKNAFIKSARIQFISKETSATTGPKLQIYALQHDTPISSGQPLSSRPRVSGSVFWQPTQWQSGAAYNTPDLAPLLQRLVSDQGFHPGRKVAFYFTRDKSDSTQNTVRANSMSAELVMQVEPGTQITPSPSPQITPSPSPGTEITPSPSSGPASPSSSSSSNELPTDLITIGSMVFAGVFVVAFFIQRAKRNPSPLQARVSTPLPRHRRPHDHRSPHSYYY